MEGTTYLCSSICGAKCCKAPMTVEVTPVEVHKLKKIAKQRKIKIRFFASAERQKLFILDHSQNGGQCPFLKDNLCSIYDDRPEACQLFPKEPVYGCLLKPKELEDGILPYIQIQLPE